MLIKFLEMINLKKIKKKKNNKKAIIFFIILLIIIIILVFIDLFIYPIISKYISFKSNPNNRADFIAYMQVIATLLTGGITVIIAFTAKRAEVKSNKIEKEKIDENYKNHIDNIYYFLSDTIYKTADNSFNFQDSKAYFDQNNKYIEDLRFLKNKILSSSEFNFINEIFSLTNQYNAGGGESYKYLKLLYKKIIDLNISPEEVKKKRIQGNLAEISSVEILKILGKLKKEINEIKDFIDDEQVIVKFLGKTKIYIKKIYDSSHYIEFNNNTLFGNISRYEPVLIRSGTISLVSEKIYEGFIRNNLFEGNGTYEYYSKNPFGNNINSYDLKEKDINYDENAQIIKSELEKRNISKTARATFAGIFKLGIMSSGIIKYKENPNDLEKSFDYSNGKV